MSYFNKIYLGRFNNYVNSKYAPYFLFIFALIESIFFPIPPDIFLIILILAVRDNALKYTIVCTLGSLIGAIIGYYIGFYFWWEVNSYSDLANFFFKYIPGFTESTFIYLQSQYQEYGFLIIFTAGFTPIPFKIFTISSGAFKLNLSIFILASLISRFIRFSIIALLISYFGKNIVYYIEKYFNKITLLISLILLIIYILFKI